MGNLLFRTSRHSPVSIATGYGLDDRGVILLSNGYWGIFLWGESGRGVKLTTHLQLVQRLRIRVDIQIHSTIRVHGVVHN
jgi:hypothetical protein